MEDKIIISLSERIKDILNDARRALDEMRGKTLIYNKYRDTQRVADVIVDVLKEIKQNERKEEGLQLGDSGVDKRPIATSLPGSF